MNTPKRFSELWTEYLEGELGESGIAELRELLAEDEKLVKLAADMYQTHRLLGLVGKEVPERQDEFIRETLCRLPEERESFISGVMSDVGRLAAPSRLRPSRTESYSMLSSGRLVVLAIVTLSLVVVLLAVSPLLLPNDPSNDPQQTSHPNSPPAEFTDGRDDVILAQAAGAELFGEFLPPVGTSLEFDHQYALTVGMIELHFPDGAKVILDAPSVIEIAGRERLVVSVGSCSVHAPPGAEGFQVETPRTEITDLGTRFSVSVNEVGETDVQVVEGLTEVRETRDAAVGIIRLAERQARRFNGDAGTGSESLKFNDGNYRRSLPDRVVSYEATTADDGTVSELQSVTVQRDGRVQTYPVDGLIGVTVIHFRAGENNANVAVPVGYDGDRLAGLESDLLLHTGVFNPGGSVESLRDDPVLVEADDSDGGDSTSGLAIRFREAVINRPGPDVVFFELQAVVNPPDGDAFHVSPLRFEKNLRSFSIRKYDIAMTSRGARPLPPFDLYFFREPATNIEALMAGAVDRRPQTLRFHALAVGIDLSDMGYANGAAVDGLFFQDVLDDGHIVDPVFIAGLPATE